MDVKVNSSEDPTMDLGYLSSNNLTDASESSKDYLSYPRKVSIRLIFEKEADVCPFWIGLFHQGKLDPRDVLDLKNMSDIFSQVATTGLSEDEPLMLSDSSISPARYIYLLPEPSKITQKEWTKRLIDTTKAWKPEKIGIYFAKELLEKGEVANLLLKVIDDLIQNTDTREYFLLAKSHGFNVLLNAAIDLKNTIDPAKHLIHIFH